MNRLGQSSGLILVAVTSSLAVFFLSLLVYQFHSEATRLALQQFSPRKSLCPVGMEKLSVHTDSLQRITSGTRNSSLVPGKNKTQLTCDSRVIVDTLVETMQNSSLVENRTLLIPPHVFKDKLVCRERLRQSSRIVSQVIYKLGVKCRKKSRIVKVYHHPQTAQLHSSEHSSTRLLVEKTLTELMLENQHNKLSNDKYASTIYERLNGVLSNHRHRDKYNLHVTVFTSEDREDSSIRTEDTDWMWRREMNLALGRKRVLIVLVSNGVPDVDRLDCLQHAASNTKINSLCVSKSMECVRTPDEKTAKVYTNCRSEQNHGFGVLVICWGCDVWHRWTHGFPVLHIQNSEVWNNLVWAYNPKH